MHIAVSEAKAQLTDLVRRSEEGEEIILTRHGQPVVMLKAMKPAPRGVTPADLEWLKANAITPKPGFESPQESLQAMRNGRNI
jgi:antitoxin (DNA-binding transcriptional repressor) of toxin-antitoxin stability system